MAELEDIRWRWSLAERKAKTGSARRLGSGALLETGEDNVDHRVDQLGGDG